MFKFNDKYYHKLQPLNIFRFARPFFTIIDILNFYQ